MNRCLLLSFRQRIQMAIARLINHSISYLYFTSFGHESISSSSKKNTVTFAFEPVQTWTEFVETTIPMINHLGPCVAVDRGTAFKLLRVVTVFFKNMEINPELRKLEGDICVL